MQAMRTAEAEAEERPARTATVEMPLLRTTLLHKAGTAGAEEAVEAVLLTRRAAPEATAETILGAREAEREARPVTEPAVRLAAAVEADIVRQEMEVTAETGSNGIRRMAQEAVAEAVANFQRRAMAATEVCMAQEAAEADMARRPRQAPVPKASSSSITRRAEEALDPMRHLHPRRRISQR